MATIRLPNGWNPRAYQLPAWKALESGIRRAVLLWHRRAGKDDMGLHWTACALIQKPATYWHMLPQANQARKAIWEAVNPHTGKRRIDEAFPLELRTTTREQEMMIKFINGSTWQVVGADNFNALVGSPPYGIIFSEYSLADPASWDYLRPILAENGGWALFIYTSRGKNHGYQLYEMARRNPQWFCEKLTVDDSKAIGPEIIEDERRSGMSEDMIQQEYYCSFEAANPGAYYGKEMGKAWEEKRICRVPVEAGLDCETWWDLGMDDSMSIWITQTVAKEIRAVQYIEGSGEGLAFYAKALKDFAAEHRVNFVRHVMPHDIVVRELGTGKSRKEVAESLGITPIAVAPRLDVEDGIECVRRVLSFFYFDETRCARGISGLTEYSKDWDDRNKVFARRPKHNWASHPADAMRTLGVTHRFAELQVIADTAMHRSAVDYEPLERA